PAADGTVQVAGLTVDGTLVGDTSATIAWESHKLTVSTARVLGFGGEATASGDVVLQPPFKYDATLHWSSLDSRQLTHLDAYGIRPLAAGGQAALAGTFEPLAVRADASGAFAPASGAGVDWHGHASYGAGAGEGEVDLAQTRANTLHARLAVAADGALS